MHAIGADLTTTTADAAPISNENTMREGSMQDDRTRHGRFVAPSTRAYITLIGAAALSAAVMHMVKSTTAADPPATLAQHSTLPVDLPQSSIDTSLQPFGL
jgi:hypothetical protein